MIVVHFPSWFPDAEKPLNGNFILRQIAVADESTTSVILHHAADHFVPELPDNVVFHRVAATSKIKLSKAYVEAFDQIIAQYGKPDIIHLHVALPLGPIAAYLANKHHIPLIVSEHWSIYQPMNRHAIHLYQKWLLHYVYKTAKHVTAVSQNLLNNICATVPVAARKPRTVVGNVVNSRLFSLKDNDLQSSKKQILHVSTLDNDAKNIMGILRAIQQLSSQRSDFELNIVHDFENKEAEDFVKSNRLSDIVHFLGRKSSSEIAELLHHSVCFLLFSNYENQPCVLLESFCTGTPVVATTVGGIPEIANNDNALLVSPKDESQLVEKLNFMLDHTGDYQPERIRENALKICSPEVIWEKWMEIYHSL